MCQTEHFLTLSLHLIVHLSSPSLTDNFHHKNLINKPHCEVSFKIFHFYIKQIYWDLLTQKTKIIGSGTTLQCGGKSQFLIQWRCLHNYFCSVRQRSVCTHVILPRTWDYSMFCQFRNEHIDMGDVSIDKMFLVGTTMFAWQIGAKTKPGTGVWQAATIILWWRKGVRFFKW